MKRDREDREEEEEEEERRTRRAPALLPAPPDWNPLDLPSDMHGEIGRYLGCAPLHRLSVARHYSEDTRKRLMFWLLQRDLYAPLLDMVTQWTGHRDPRAHVAEVVEARYSVNFFHRERVLALLAALAAGPAGHSRLQLATLYADYMDWVLLPFAISWVAGALTKAVNNHLVYDTIPASREADVCILSTPGGTPVALFRLRLAAYQNGAPDDGALSFDVRLLPGANLRQTSWYALLEALGRSDHKVVNVPSYLAMEKNPVARALAGVLRTLLLEEGTECVLGIRGQQLVPRLPGQPVLSFPSCVVNLARAGLGEVTGPVLDQDGTLHPDGLSVGPNAYLKLAPVPVVEDAQ